MLGPLGLFRSPRPAFAGSSCGWILWALALPGPGESEGSGSYPDRTPDPPQPVPQISIHAHRRTPPLLDSTPTIQPRPLSALGRGHARAVRGEAWAVEVGARLRPVSSQRIGVSRDLRSLPFEPSTLSGWRAGPLTWAISAARGFQGPPLGLRKVYGSHHSVSVHYCGRAERVRDAAAYPLETASDLFWGVHVSEDRRFP